MNNKRKTMSTSYSDVPIGIRLIQRFTGNAIHPNRLFRYKILTLNLYCVHTKNEMFQLFHCLKVDSLSIHSFFSNFKCSYKLSVLVLTYLTYTCYHLTRKPISVVKAVLHRNCSLLKLSGQPNIVTDASNDSTWCDYAPFGKYQKCCQYLLNGFATV